MHVFHFRNHAGKDLRLGAQGTEALKNVYGSTNPANLHGEKEVNLFEMEQLNTRLQLLIYLDAILKGLIRRK